MTFVQGINNLSLKPITKDEVIKKQELAFKDVYKQFYEKFNGPTVRTEFLSNNNDPKRSRPIGLA